jgi:hypothetical protein
VLRPAATVAQRPHVACQMPSRLRQTALSHVYYFEPSGSQTVYSL